MLLTKFSKNPIKHVEEEADCEKKERKKEEETSRSQKVRRHRLT